MSRKSTKIEVKGVEVIFTQNKQEDFISITDIAKYKNPDAPRDIIKNWMRSKNTIELLGLWERLHNPDFKQVEFDLFRNEAGLNAFTLSPQKWVNNTNAVFINDGILQSERLQKLNQIAIGQMKILVSDNSLNKLEDGK